MRGPCPSAAATFDSDVIGGRRSAPHPRHDFRRAFLKRDDPALALIDASRFGGARAYMPQDVAVRNSHPPPVRFCTAASSHPRSFLATRLATTNPSSAAAYGKLVEARPAGLFE